MRYQTDWEEKRTYGGRGRWRCSAADDAFIVVVVVPARDGSGSGDGYQNCACHYNFKAGFPRSTVAWSLVQEAGGRGGVVRNDRGREAGERAVRGGHR